jgi:predicted N-acetyltransferase YhbS
MMGKLRELPPKQWQVRLTKKQDAPAISALLNTVFGNWGDQATWSWKYEKTPTPFRLNSAVAAVDGRLVGHYGIIPLTISHHGKVIRGAQAVDAAVLPEYRRQGMMSTLARCVLEAAAEAQVPFIYAFPGLYSLKLNQRIGFQPVMFIPEMVRLLDAKRFLIERLRSFPTDMRTFWRWRYKGDWSPNVLARLTHLRTTFLWMLSWWSAPVWHHNMLANDFTVRRLSAFDASFDTFYQADVVLSLEKSADYLTWRYLQHPDQVYQSWGAYRSGDLVGYLVMNIAEFKCSICELAYLPNNEHVIFPLVETATRAAREAGRHLLSAWVSENNPLWPAFRKLGFISPYRLHRFAANCERLSAQFYQIILYTQHLHSQLKTQLLDDLRFWSLAMGDSDLI